MKGKNINISSLNMILKIWYTLFGLLQTEKQCSKNYFNFFLNKKLEFLERKSHEKPQKTTKATNHKSYAQNWKNIYDKYLKRIFDLLAIQCKW